jgi:NAD(P)-dependent dehydrogenase (short-subunit alcohol dehydrogenase family)
MHSELGTASHSSVPKCDLILLPVPTAGARVVIACRDTKKAQEAADDIRLDTKEVEGPGHVVVVSLDLASLASVRQCAQHLLRTERAINILVNNAGKVAHLLITCLLISAFQSFDIVTEQMTLSELV